MTIKIIKLKKAQAAFEFLTTYGWSILLILIMVGSLAYFGILDLRAVLPDSCILIPEIECLGYILAQTDLGTGVLRLKLKNKFNGQIVVNSWDVSSDSTTPFSCNSKPTTSIWSADQIKDFQFSGCNNKDAGLIIGKTAKVNFKLNYYTAESSDLSHDLKGEIVTTVTTIDDFLATPYFPLYCFVSTNCPYTTVFRISDLKDTHAEIPSLSNYKYKVCCKAFNDTLSNTCTSPQSIPLHLSNSTDAHVEKQTQSNYGVNICLSGNIKTVSCSYSTSDCLTDETCIATISDDTDANVGDCVTQPFDNKVCCKIA